MSKKYFEAIGRQRQSLGFPMPTGKAVFDLRAAGLPDWAIAAIRMGHSRQKPWRWIMRLEGYGTPQ